MTVRLPPCHFLLRNSCCFIQCMFFFQPNSDSNYCKWNVLNTALASLVQLSVRCTGFTLYTQYCTYSIVAECKGWGCVVGYGIADLNLLKKLLCMSRPCYQLRPHGDCKSYDWLLVFFCCNVLDDAGVCSKEHLESYGAAVKSRLLTKKDLTKWWQKYLNTAVVCSNK